MSQPASVCFSLSTELPSSLAPVVPLCQPSVCLLQTFCHTLSAHLILPSASLISIGLLSVLVVLSPTFISCQSNCLMGSIFSCSPSDLLPPPNACGCVKRWILSFSRKARDSLPTFRQFFSSAFSLTHVSLASVKVPPDSLRWVTDKDLQGPLKPWHLCEMQIPCKVWSGKRGTS